MSVVTEVALNDNNISDLPLYAWQAFRWVRVLSLAKNQLKALGSGARLLAGIETLDLSENPIETLSEVHHVVSLRRCAMLTTAPPVAGRDGTNHAQRPELEQVPPG